MSVYFTPEANRHLREIWRFSAEEWGLRQADRYLTELINHAEAVTKNEALARPRPELRADVHVCPARSHNIFLSKRASGDWDVVAILHKRMDTEGWFETLKS